MLPLRDHIRSESVIFFCYAILITDVATSYENLIMQYLQNML